MRIKFFEPLEVSDGVYNARIIDIDEVPSKSKCLVKLQPYDEESSYEELLLWIGEECSTKSVMYEFFQTLGITSAEISVEELRNKFLNSCIGIEIENNETKDGRIFHNIVSFFDADEPDDDFDEDEDFEGEDEEDDDDENDSETEADSESEDLEETGSFDNEDSGRGEGVLEGNLSKSEIKSARRSGNNRRNRRR